MAWSAFSAAEPQNPTRRMIDGTAETGAGRRGQEKGREVRAYRCTAISMPSSLFTEDAITRSKSAGRQVALPDPHQDRRHRECDEDEQGKRPGSEAISELPPGWRDWFRFVYCHRYLKPRPNEFSEKTGSSQRTPHMVEERGTERAVHAVFQVHHLEKLLNRIRSKHPVLLRTDFQGRCGAGTMAKRKGAKAFRTAGVPHFAAGQASQQRPAVDMVASDFRCYGYTYWQRKMPFNAKSASHSSPGLRERNLALNLA